MIHLGAFRVYPGVWQIDAARWMCAGGTAVEQSNKLRPRYVRRMFVALTLAAGAVVLLPGAAQAQPDTTGSTTPVTCRPGEATSADRVLAAQLRSSMTGPRLGSLIGGTNI